MALVKSFTTFMGHIKLHIPGTGRGSVKKTFRAFVHRLLAIAEQGFKDLYAGIQPRLQENAFNQATRLSQHFFRLGSHGRRHP